MRICSTNVVKALVAVGAVAGALATASAEAAPAAFVVRPGHPVERTWQSAATSARVEIQVAPAHRACVLRVRSGARPMVSARLRGPRVIRLAVPVRRQGVQIVLSARGGAVRVRSIAIARESPPPPPSTAPAPSPAPAPAATAAPSPPSYTRLVWSDDFNGAAGAPPAASSWSYETGSYWGDGQLQAFTNRTRNAQLDGQGDLSLIAQKDVSRDGRVSYTSARLRTYGKVWFRYGRVEARIKTPPGAGLLPQFWMMGTDIDRSGWPLCGEMDVMEMLGQQPDTVWAHLHGPLASNSSTEYPVGTGYRAPTALTDDYHVYGLVWSPDTVVWTLDGTPYYTVRQSDLGPDRRWVYDHDFSLLLSMVVGGSWAGSPSPSTAFPATMSVDWIRIYQ